MVVDKGEAILVEDGSSVSLGYGNTNGIRDTLSQRASSDLNTRGVVGLGVTGSDAVNFLHSLFISS